GGGGHRCDPGGKGGGGHQRAVTGWPSRAAQARIRHAHDGPRHDGRVRKDRCCESQPLEWWRPTVRYVCGSWKGGRGGRECHVLWNLLTAGRQRALGAGGSRTITIVASASRCHCPVVNSITQNTTPLMSQSKSKQKCHQRARSSVVSPVCRSQPGRPTASSLAVQACSGGSATSGRPALARAAAANHCPATTRHHESDAGGRKGCVSPPE